MSIGKIAMNYLSSAFKYAKANPLKTCLIGGAFIYGGHKFSGMSPEEKKKALFYTSMATIPFCVLA